MSHEVFAGSDLEGYLRAAQLLGKAPFHPWSVRSFGPSVARRLAPRDSVHPWAGRYAFADRPGASPTVRLVRPRAQAIFNSAFPHGGNDGVIWAGRGLTTAVQLGFAAEYGPVSLVVAPVAFRAENTAFELANPEAEGDAAYRNPIAGGIDLPQRFGDEPYARLDPGESTLRLDVLGLAAGISTAGQIWGPAAEQPLILGMNAGGFPHVFAGTSTPLDLWVAKVHGRMIWGRIEQSEWSAVPDSLGSRFATAMVALIQPRGVLGLEIGFTRFYHMPWGEDGPDSHQRWILLESFLKENVAGADERPENQLASAFFRWSPPEAGVELYGELMREDHSWDVRRFFLDPEDLHAYSLGFARAWQRAPDRWLTFRVEVANAESSHRERDNRRTTAAIPIYTHSQLRQGHTSRGQLLVTGAGPAGAVTTVAVQSYRPTGGWGADWTRVLRRDRTAGLAGGADRSGDVSVVHTLGGSLLFFVRQWDVRAGLAGVYEMNRHLRGDALNLRADLGMTWNW